MASCEPTTSVSLGVIPLPPNISARGIKVVNIAASRGGSSSSSSSGGSTGSRGNGDNGFAEVGSVSCLRRNHGTSQALSDSSCPSGIAVHATLPHDTSIVNLDQAFVQDNTDPLSYFMASWQNDHDPFNFGVGSVADGTFGGRQPTCEQLMLFRSHRLMQAEAVSVVMGNAYSLSASVRKRFGLIGGAVAHQVWVKLLEKTNSTIERIRTLGRDGIPNQQQEIISEERKTSHRMIAEILDNATSSLREILGSGYSHGTASSCSGSSGFDSSNRFGSSTCSRNHYSTTTMEPELGSESGNRSVLASSMLELTSSSEAHQLATRFAWEGTANTSCVTLAPGPSIPPPITTTSPTGKQHHQPHQHQPSLHSHAGKGRPSVFALNHWINRPHHAPIDFTGGLSNANNHGVDERQSTMGVPSLMGPFPSPRASGRVGGLNSGGSAMPEALILFDQGGVSAPAFVESWNAAGGDAGCGDGGGGKEATCNDFKARTNKNSLLLTKMGPKPLIRSGSALSNRKGSRHRLTPMAKEILEGWLAKHWLNPYPTEAEKLHLSQICKITVTQVNNWMMNVRVRRCRTKRIGVATGPEQITYPSNITKAKVRSQHDRPSTDVLRSVQDTVSTPLTSGPARSRLAVREEPKSPLVTS